MSRFGRILKLVSSCTVVLTVGGLFILSGCSNNSGESKTLKLYIPGEYMSDSLIPNFEQKFGVKVVVENFESNEEMFEKLTMGAQYDVLVPSDYMIERLLRLNMLQPRKKGSITNINLLSDAVKNLSFDPANTYSIPYFWGNVGIVYNKKNVDPEDVKKNGFAIFKDTKYAGKVYWYDSERDSFMCALKSLGYSMNTEDTDELSKAYTWLREMTDTMKPEFVTDEVLEEMPKGTKDLAIVYSGDAATILSENEDMDFFAPEEGTNVWYDAMVIPTNASAPKLANEFINYVISYEAALDNTKSVGYTSVNAQVAKEMSSDGGDYSGNAAYIPRTGYNKDEIFHDKEIIQIVTADLWGKLKAAHVN